MVNFSNSLTLLVVLGGQARWVKPITKLFIPILLGALRFTQPYPAPGITTHVFVGWAELS